MMTSISESKNIIFHDKKQDYQVIVNFFNLKWLKYVILVVLVLFFSDHAFAINNGKQITGEKKDREKVFFAISERLALTPSIKGQFIQFSPDGKRTEGKFYIQRPGKVRFTYADPYPIEIISDGTTIAVNNKKLKTWDMYLLSSTPLKMLLKDKFLPEDDTIKNIVVNKYTIELVLASKKNFQNSEITLVFDSEKYILKQWRVRDAQGRETSVEVFNVMENTNIPAKTFYIDYNAPRYPGQILDR